MATNFHARKKRSVKMSIESRNCGIVMLHGGCREEFVSTASQVVVRFRLLNW